MSYEVVLDWNIANQYFYDDFDSAEGIQTINCGSLSTSSELKTGEQVYSYESYAFDFNGVDDGDWWTLKPRCMILLDSTTSSPIDKTASVGDNQNINSRVLAHYGSSRAIDSDSLVLGTKIVNGESYGYVMGLEGLLWFDGLWKMAIYAVNLLNGSTNGGRKLLMYMTCNFTEDNPVGAWHYFYSDAVNARIDPTFRWFSSVSVWTDNQESDLKYNDFLSDGLIQYREIGV